MKKITWIVLVCLTPVVTMAHEIPVPHDHQAHGILPLLQYVVLPIALGLGIVKLYRTLKRSNQELF
jgi:hypothetical protein